MTAVSSTMTSEGLLVTNSDGSTVMQRSDGTTIITTVTCTIYIYIDMTIVIMMNSVMTTINADGSMSSVNTATNEMMSMSVTGEINMSAMVNGSLV